MVARLNLSLRNHDRLHNDLKGLFPNLNGQLLIGLAITLGIGLLVVVERERRKGSGPTRRSAGIRTFALASLTGAIS
jgi:hypothetical protein